ncbi:hypothetical protein RC62_1469 [Flavobacterium aquidurense]|uniref:Uncharacterized protein n=1 Tax=Flavobacterium aquidurense TaxID=362413 RepID=A0A0Q1BGN5_9FLAO|nr:hypothetical protein RC62_1469 [Flavobacterium aquidurense]
MFSYKYNAPLELFFTTDSNFHYQKHLQKNKIDLIYAILKFRRNDLYCSNGF